MECVVVFALPIKCVTIIVVTSDKWRKEGASISAFHQKSELCDRFSPFKQMVLLLFLDCYSLRFNYFLSRRLSCRWPRACLFSAEIIWNRGNPTERSNHRKQKKRSFCRNYFYRKMICLSLMSLWQTMAREIFTDFSNFTENRAKRN
jgi:hypothetical protein